MTRKSTGWLKVATVASASVLLLAAGCGGGSGGGGGGDASNPVTLNIAMAANPDPQRLVKLILEFEKQNPGIKINATLLDEVTLRDKLAQGIPTQSGEFDAVMAGPIDAPQWARNGWVVDLDKYATESANYDVNDLLPPIRGALSLDGKLIGVPFTGESSFVYYRKDLFKKAGLTMPPQPTWDQIEQYAATLTNRGNDLAGICLRGQAGWGSNMPTFINFLHAYGGHIYDPSWRPGLNTPEAKRALQQYLDIITKSGEKGAANSSFQECQNLFNQGKVAMWYDATSVAPTTFDPKSSEFASQTAVAQVPKGSVAAGGWLWSWAFVMLKTSKNQDATWKFMEWATSKSYIKLAGDTYGFNLAPPGTRTSTYNNPDYQKAAKPYAALSLSTINAAKTQFPGANERERASWVDIPEWPATGDELGRILAAAIAGDKTVDQTLAEMNKVLADTAKEGGYV